MTRRLKGKTAALVQENRTGTAWVCFLFVFLFAVFCLASFAEENESNQKDETGNIEVKTNPVAGKVSMITGVGGFVGGNVGVSAGEDGLLIIDDQLTPFSKKLEAELTRLQTDKEIPDLKFVLNTHYHFDHVGGNAHFGKRAVIIAHENLRKVLANPIELNYFDLKMDAYPKEALPVITFRNTISVHFNGEEIQVTHLPKGHTNTDSIVYFTESNVLHTGDLMFNGMFPFVDVEHDGNVLGVTKNIKKIMNTFPSDVKIIPGHGPLADMNDLKAYHTMLVQTTKVVRNGIKAGKSLEEIQAAGLPEKWKSWEWDFIRTSAWISFIHASLLK